MVDYEHIFNAMVPLEQPGCLSKGRTFVSIDRQYCLGVIEIWS